MKPLENQMKIYFRFFTLMGQFPFKITEEGLMPSAILKLYGIIPMVSLISFATYMAVSGSLHLGGTRETTLRMAFFVLGVCLLGTTVVVPVCRSNLYCSLFQRFKRVDGYFRYLGIANEERKNIYPPLQILFNQIFVLGVIIGTDLVSPYWVSTNSPMAGMIFYYIITVIMTFVTVNCGTYAHLLSTRFQAINDELENIDKKSNKMDKILDSQLINDLYRRNINMKIFPQHENQIYRTMNLKKSEDVAGSVRLLQKSYYELYGICSSLGGLFTFPVVLTVFFTGCEVLFTCYTGFGKVLTDSVVGAAAILTWLKYIIYDLTRVVCIVKAFTTIEKAGNTTSYHVHGLILKTEDSDTQKELMKFSQQLLHQKINFSTCGFFSLNWSLLVSMTGAITTYLVILLQFSGRNDHTSTSPESITERENFKDHTSN